MTQEKSNNSIRMPSIAFEKATKSGAPENAISIHESRHNDNTKNASFDQDWSFGEQLLYGLLGTPDAMLTPEDLRARESRRAAAGQIAKNAYSNPGGQFMSPPAGGSGNGLESLATIAGFLKGAAGAIF